MQPPNLPLGNDSGSTFAGFAARLFFVYLK
jgi:hypothetical protein